MWNAKTVRGDGLEFARYTQGEGDIVSWVSGWESGHPDPFLTPDSWPDSLNNSAVDETNLGKLIPSVRDRCVRRRTACGIRRRGEHYSHPPIGLLYRAPSENLDPLSTRTHGCPFRAGTCGTCCTPSEGGCQISRAQLRAWIWKYIWPHPPATVSLCPVCS